MSINNVYLVVYGNIVLIFFIIIFFFGKNMFMGTIVDIIKFEKIKNYLNFLVKISEVSSS